MKFSSILQQYNDIDLAALTDLVIHVTSKSKAFLLAHKEYEITKNQLKELQGLIKRHKAGEPLQLLFQKVNFYNSTFKVNSDNLIPRNETEILVELAYKEVQILGKRDLNILEVGFGTGCISISLLKELELNKSLENITIIATDINPSSAELAKLNAKMNLSFSTLKHIEFRTVDIVEPIQDTKYDLILSNPPYIPTHDYLTLDKSVKDYEPRSALDGGKTGLDVYKAILKRIKPHIYTTTICLFEIYHAPKFREQLQLLIEGLYPKAQITFHKDLRGKQRFCKITTLL